MMDTNLISFNASTRQSACAQCSLRESCLPGRLRPDQVGRLDALIGARRRIARGQYLYRSSEAFSAIYAIRRGFFKTDVVAEDGRDQITGFQMAGDFLGMDGIGGEAYTCNAIALEDSEVCRIPFAELERLASGLPALQHHLHQLMSREIVRDQGVMAWLGSLPADKGLAAFLLNLSQRFTARGYSPTEFHLRMTRKEIGSHLGHRLQTVSRSFSRFREEGVISVDQKHVRILDIAALKNTVRKHSPGPARHLARAPALES